jgi:hypothetical protein
LAQEEEWESLWAWGLQKARGLELRKASLLELELGLAKAQVLALDSTQVSGKASDSQWGWIPASVSASRTGLESVLVRARLRIGCFGSNPIDPRCATSKSRKELVPHP